MQDCRTESIVAAVLLSIKMVKVGFNVDIKKKIKSVDAIFWFVGIFFILSLIFVPGFAQLSAIKSLLTQACVLIIISCGVHLTVLNGGVDHLAYPDDFWFLQDIFAPGQPYTFLGHTINAA